METVELHLDAKTLEQARQLAAVHQRSLDELIAQAIQKYAEMEAQHYPLLGLFADEPTVVDEMMESVNRDRAVTDNSSQYHDVKDDYGFEQYNLIHA